ncbi:N-acetyldiaminopimelate deacetylase [Sediminibacillus halophilus]|uniref:N-acetyldiaminopimelate deacetylase n=1 Tax=Sediminibacillus halophilus TaxID=482461 RepID=A0A1G9MYH8_9BACI|nr:N-acetyldiaminopimelate deacetylase [Sediminibacillus halophilus]SDL79174.1 N-acetyldiaminopimelate deacetylase [Sediminibacillus halophilus]
MNHQELVKIRRDLHQIPELGFQEFKTQRYLQGVIARLPQKHLTIKQWRTGLLVKVSGSNPSRLIGYRTDIDGLPITEETDYSFSSKHEGNMHACGHDFHMTIALGALQRLAEQPMDDDVLFIFQPAEEGPGGALPMLQTALLGEWRPDVVFALHVAPELPAGMVSTREGLLFANTSELFIDFKGKGGHAAYPHLTHDMVAAASSFVTQLQQIVARRIDPLQSAVVTIGKITGGSVQNVIAERARLEGTIRTLDPEAIGYVKQHIEQIAKGHEISFDCTIDIDYGANYYQVYNSTAYIDRFKRIVSQEQLTWQEAKAAMTGEDFGYMLKEIPGFMFWLGVDSPYGLHHGKLRPSEDALSTGVHIVEKTIRNL